MVKKYKIILTVLLAVLIVVGIVTVTGVLDINRLVKEKEEENNVELTATYQDMFVTMTDENSPLLKTDIENVYYAMDMNGDVRFYRIENAEVTLIEESGSFEVTAPCSGQDLPATIHYIETENGTVGYGLFTNTDHPDIYLYDYAFFKVTEMFPDFASNAPLLMLLDVDKSRFHQDEKVFSESFYLYANQTCEHFLNENQRIPGIDARMREDYKMFTSDILGQTGNVLFFSARYYNEGSDVIDILTSGGSGENVDNVQYITGVTSLHMWENNEGVLYFAKTDGGFTLRCFDGKDHSDIKTFEGDLENDYLINGRYILNKASGEIYNVLDGSTQQLDYSGFKKDFEPDMFSMSENGVYCVVRGADNGYKPAIGMADFVAGTMTDFEDDVFGYIAALHVQNDGTVVISAVNGDSASSHYQLLGVVGRMWNAEYEPAETGAYTIAE